MRKLETVQEHEKLNTVFAVDNPGAGGANHLYRIEANNNSDMFALVQFQNGARKDEKSIPGIIDSDLLEIVRDRLKAFQNSEFACKYNEEALHHVEAALKAMNERVENRIGRKVLGTYSV